MSQPPQLGPYMFIPDSRNTTPFTPASPSSASRARLCPGYDTTTGARVTIRSLPGCSEEALERLVRLRGLQHENWAKVHHVSRHGHVVVAVGEERPWCLDGFCHAEAPGLDERVRIMRQCAAGLDYLHALPEPVLHGNLSPETIIIQRSETFAVAKLCDPLLDLPQAKPNEAAQKLLSPQNLFSALSQDISAPNSGYSPRPDISSPNSGYSPRPDISAPNSGYSPRPDISAPNSGYSPRPDSSAPNSVHSPSRPDIMAHQDSNMVHIDSDYLAPELLISDRITNATDISALVTKETDIFALGVIFWRLLQYDVHSGFNVKERYAGGEHSIAECLHRLRDVNWSPVHVLLADPPRILKLKALISTMLQYRPEDRPTARQTLQVLTEILSDDGATNGCMAAMDEGMSTSDDEDEVEMIPVTSIPNGMSERIQVDCLKALTFENEVWTGFGYGGECIIGARYENALGHLRDSLTCYKLTQAPTTFQHLWRKPMPSGVSIKCSKFVSKSGNILLHDKGATLMFNHRMQPLRQFGAEGGNGLNGRGNGSNGTSFGSGMTSSNNSRNTTTAAAAATIRNTSTNNRTSPTTTTSSTNNTTFTSNNRQQSLYHYNANRVSAIHLDAWYLCDSLDGVLGVRDQLTGELLRRVRVQRGHREDFRSIVCCNPETGYTAVACAEMSSLEIFNTEGASLMTQSLPYRPCHMSSSSRHLLVAQWGPAPVLHVHAWGSAASGLPSGGHVAQLAPRRLGLAASERVCGMSPLMEDGIVMLAVWCRKSELDRVVAYKMGDEDGWGVIGSRPGSATGMYPDTPTDVTNGFSFTPKDVNRTFTKPSKYNSTRGKAPSPEPWRGGGNSGRSSASPTPHGQNYFLSKSKPKPDNSLFSGPALNGSGDWETRGNAQKTYTRSQTPTGKKSRPQTPQSPGPRSESPGMKTRNYYGHVWNYRNESYADESLFGPKPEEPNFKAPWDNNKPPKYVFDATDYKALEIKKQLQNAAKNSKKHTKGPTKTDSERVDHIERALRSQLAVHGEKPQAKASSRDSNSGRPSTPKKAPKFKESYVDELLFGSQPKEPDFPAPWEDNKKRTIHAFDGTSGSVTINHENGSFSQSRPGSTAGSRAGSRRGSTGDVQTLRPAWR